MSGNVEFPASVEFVAHENTQRLMRENNPVRGLGGDRPHLFDQNNAPGLPERTFSDTLTLGSGADRVELHYFGRAHTGGDAWVVFPSLRVMHAGDAFPGKMVPIMDSNNGGSGVDYPDTLRKASHGISNVDRIITGHSTVMTPADLSEYADFVGTFLSDVRTAKTRGASVADFVSDWQVPSRFSAYNRRTGGAPAGLRAGYLRRAAVAGCSRTSACGDRGWWCHDRHSITPAARPADHQLLWSYTTSESPPTPEGEADRSLA